jgi:hypothetical protein
LGTKGLSRLQLTATRTPASSNICRIFGRRFLLVGAGDCACMRGMTTRSIVSLGILLGLCVTGCPESKTETAPEPKSPAEPVKAEGDDTKADEGTEGASAKEKEAAEGEEKDEEGGW